jgi:TatA/E family protein of Tat protein translocase
MGVFEGNLFAPQELIIILLIALLLFGGKQLPEIGSSLGKAIREFKRATEEFQRPVEPERPPAPPPTLTTQTGHPAGQVTGIGRAKEGVGGEPEALEPGMRLP